MHPPEYYAALRKEWTPAKPKLIVIAESPPESGKYFYDDSGKPTEPLFLALMESLVGRRKFATKKRGLQAFRDGGFLLLDATYTPVDGIDDDKERDRMIALGIPRLKEYLAAADPTRNAPLLLVKANVCRIVKAALQQEGYRILNGEAVVPFPSNGNQGKFREIVSTIWRTGE